MEEPRHAEVITNHLFVNIVTLRVLLTSARSQVTFFIAPVERSDRGGIRGRGFHQPFIDL